MENQLKYWFLILLVVTAAVQIAAGAQLQNIALNKSYTVSAKPNYSPGTDDENKKLTDGFSDPQMEWGTDSTVGWNIKRKAIQITIDLGRVEPVAGVSFSCVAGAAGVSWPLSIEVAVSEDGKVFYPACELYRLTEDPLPPSYTGSHPYTFRTQQLRTKGRYVRFNVLPASFYLFCDEIEVYRGSNKLLDVVYSNKPATVEQIKDRAKLTRIGCYRRIRRDLETVQTMVRDKSPAGADKLMAKLNRLRAKLDKSQFPEDEDVESFKAIVPYNELHAQVFKVYSRLLPKQDKSGILIWHTPRYQMLSMFEKPGDPISALTIIMAQNERRAEVFNVTNTSEQARILSFKIEGLPGGINPDYIRPHQVEYVDGREGEVIASALVPLVENGGVFVSTIPAGMTRQIWLSADWPQVKAGNYDGRITLNCGSDRKEIKLNLSIAPVRLPDKLDCDLGMWDYIANINRPRYGVTKQNQAAAIKDMIEHKVNIVWGEGRSLPQAEVADFDAEGNLIGQIDYTGWEKFVKMWPEADHCFVSASFRNNAVFCGHKEGTESFDLAVSQFASNWAEHNRRLGLKPGRAGVLFVDEPGNEGMYKTTYLFAKAFKAGTDEIAFGSTPGIDKGVKNMADIKYAREALELCDILWPNLSNTIMELDKSGQDFYRQRQAEGAIYWVYQCNIPTRMANPSYFRIQAWYCLRYGATGVNFWAYSCTGSMNGWNEYPSFGSTTDSPPYFSPTTVTTSKNWEAVLESREDFQYVKMLKERITELEKADLSNPNLKEARSLADSIVDSVLDGVASRYGRWYGAKLSDNPSAIAEQGRLKTLKMLAAIQESK